MRLPLILAMIVISLLAFGYANQDGRGSPLTGLWHPLFGFELLLAVVGVGAWGAVLRGPAVWAVPAAFVVGAALGCAMARNGDGQLPYVGLMLILSVIMLVLAVLLPVRMPVQRAAALVSLFGVYHGYAYAAELEPVEAASSADQIVVAALTHGRPSPTGALLRQEPTLHGGVVAMAARHS